MTMNWIMIAFFIQIIIGVAFGRPQPFPKADNNNGNIPLAWMMSGVPTTGMAGFFDNFGATLANVGNAKGSSANAASSGFGGVGTIFSGLFGSGTIDTSFLNYNNRPPFM